MQKHTGTGQAFRETVADYLSSLIESRNYAGAVEYYEAHRSDIDSVGGAWAGAILLKVARACASLTDYPAALKLARTAQSMAAADGDSPLLADIFYTLGGILRDMGQVKEARKAFHDAESIFRRNDHLEGQSRALNQLAGLMFRNADYPNALRVLMDAVDIARRLDDQKKLAFMMGNIGRLHTFMGDLAEAQKHLKINIEISKDLGDDTEVAKAYLSLAYVHLQQAAYGKAREALNEAYPRILTSDSRRDEAIYYSYLGELHLRTGQYDLAADALTKALAIAEKVAPESTLVGRLLRVQAELLVRQDNFRMAAKTAARAMVIMEEAGNKVEIGALVKIKAQVAAAKKQKKEALEQFRRSIDLLDEAGVRFEKAEAMVAAGQCELLSTQQRMMYLFRAEEYYARCRMTVRQDEVSRLISALGDEGPARSKAPAEVRESKLDYLTASPQIERFKKQLALLGRPDLPVLLTGETGVGKDHMARYFHSLVRPDGPYVAINCASVPETLLESELFGYNRGAFTGADGNKQGLFVAANKGVLLLDEIGDMPLSLQAKLLGVLERRKVIPLGSTREIDLDIIIVAATNKNLEDMVENGTFRRDLYYRLSGVIFNIPSLRERKQDIPLLLEYFMRRRGLLSDGETLPPDLLRRFVAYEWPGNIRELENKVKRLQVMHELVAEGDLTELTHSLFPELPEGASDSDTLSLFDRVEQFERKLLVEALTAASGNKSEAARMLGVHEATVRTKLKRYNISLGGDEVRLN